MWATFRNEIAYHLGKWEISTDSDYHCSSNFYSSGLTLSHLRVIKTFSPTIMKTLLSWHVRRITTPNSQNNMKKIIPLIDLLVLFRIKWLQMELWVQNFCRWCLLCNNCLTDRFISSWNLPFADIITYSLSFTQVFCKRTYQYGYWLLKFESVCSWKLKIFFPWNCMKSILFINT